MYAGKMNFYIQALSGVQRLKKQYVNDEVTTLGFCLS